MVLRRLNGIVLSCEERDKFTWADTERMSEERRSALASRVSKEREGHLAPTVKDRPPDASRGSNSRSMGKKVVKICTYYNNGSCPHSGHHEISNTRWRHACKECLEVGHVDKMTFCKCVSFLH
jgi:hypothetical protein